MAEFNVLKGETLKEINVESDERITFVTESGKKYLMYHSQDCCEFVTIESINGDLKGIIGYPVLNAEERTNSETHPEGVDLTNIYDDSFTWTFYVIETIKETVTIRWLGESNGYYSEEVDFEDITEGMDNVW